ncbi:MAG: hypothetical protein QM771_12540 [Nitrospira sp.]
MAGFDLPSLYLPFDATQRHRQAALPPPDVLAASLADAVKGLPFRAGLFEPFLHDVEMARTSPLIDIVNLQQTPFFSKSGRSWCTLVTCGPVSCHCAM